MLKKNITKHCDYPKIISLQEELSEHPVFKQGVWSLETCRYYMEYHIWCVWDFMYLLKNIEKYAISRDMWLPQKSPEKVHLIYTLLLSEEVDITPSSSGKQSHFESFIDAMEQANADTKEINTFIEKLYGSLNLRNIFEEISLPKASKKFTIETIGLAEESIFSALGAFVFGRELLIPDMFGALKGCIPENPNLSDFLWYVNRHIYLDTAEHSSLAEQLLNQTVHNESSENITIVIKSAIQALQSRRDLLDAFYRKINE